MKRNAAINMAANSEEDEKQDEDEEEDESEEERSQDEVKSKLILDSSPPAPRRPCTLQRGDSCADLNAGLNPDLRERALRLLRQIEAGTLRRKHDDGMSDFVTITARWGWVC